ncbi:MAG: bifunctional [glutamate--ammonia ligase]-adenylyl-L-tyrosine phosphorylase/[glutamate--ammonia-ligase] adenylyltransferase [Arenicellales bacterium WSBS_2016_MAG_OTU3]
MLQPPTSSNVLENIDLSALPETFRSTVFEQIHDCFASADAAARESLEQLDAYESIRKSLPQVFAGSEFIARFCQRENKSFSDLLTSGDLQQSLSADQIAQGLSHALASADVEADYKACLRKFCLRESVRIAWRDLSGWAGLDEVIAARSTLADAVVQHSLAFAYEMTSAAFGKPQLLNDAATPLIVFGLGKLGGGELNFSSDIDLVFAYAEDGETQAAPGVRKTISHHEFFVRCARCFIRLVDEITADGQAFRVDARLRPNGDAGPLALSFDAMEHYFQLHGREWERYAWIKARVIGEYPAPAKKKNSHGQHFLKVIRPFVYRKYLDFGAVQSIRDMQRMIENELRKKGSRGNVKLGRGGIREIEFIAQSYQLVHGGRSLNLQTQQLKSAFTELVAAGLIEHEDSNQLWLDYVFLRNVEHRLQMVNQQQTHKLPESGNEQQRLAFTMGFEDWATFSLALGHVQQRVAKQFAKVFGDDKSDDKGDDKSETSDASLGQLWPDALDDDNAIGLLSAAGFDDPERALQTLKGFRDGRHYQGFSRDGRKKADDLMPKLLQQIVAEKNPDTALSRVLQVLEQIGRRSSYLVLLRESHVALAQLVSLTSISQWVANWIGQHPVILDELLSPVGTESLPTRAELGVWLKKRLQTGNEEDLDFAMTVLREFKHGQLLQVAAANMAARITAEDVGHSLSDLATVSLQQVVELARKSIGKRFGKPVVNKANAHEPDGTIGILAYGKLGSRELGYHSDLDIVFLYDASAFENGETTGGDKNVGLEYYFSRLTQRMVHIITTRTPAGLLYEIDMRLRPSGSSGTVVSSLQAYEAYQMHAAWTWEHQALVRGRLLSNNPDFVVRFETVRKNILMQPRDKTELALQISKMRERMIQANSQSTDALYDIKLDSGGMVDIEFLSQFLVLSGAASEPSIIEPRTTVDILKCAADLGLIAMTQANGLCDIYYQYVEAERSLKLNEQPALVLQADFSAERKQVRATWKQYLQTGELN